MRYTEARAPSSGDIGRLDFGDRVSFTARDGRESDLQTVLPLPVTRVSGRRSWSQEFFHSHFDDKHQAWLFQNEFPLSAGEDRCGGSLLGLKFKFKRPRLFVSISSLRVSSPCGRQDAAGPPHLRLYSRHTPPYLRQNVLDKAAISISTTMQTERFFAYRRGCCVVRAVARTRFGGGGGRETSRFSFPALGSPHHIMKGSHPPVCFEFVS